MFDSVLKKVLVCASIGFIAGLILGIIYGATLNDGWLPFVTPFAGALYIIGIVFGFALIKKGFETIMRFIGSTARVGSHFMRSFSGIIITLLVIFLIANYVIRLFLAVCWIPGVFIAGKALLNELRGYYSLNQNDEFSDKYFKPLQTKPRKKIPRLLDKKFNNNDWN